MAPKRKASSSNPASSSKPVKKGGPKSRPEGYWPKKNKPAPKKARVEVEYEESSSSKKNGKKGPQPTIAKPKPKLKPVAPPKQAEPAKKKGADKGGKQLTFADESVPYVSPFADEDDLVQTTTPKPKKPKAPLPTGPRTFQIVAGSYEKLLYGLQGVFPEDGKSHEFALKPVFIFPAHQACVKTVAASEGGKWLATGSTDEVVKIWDLRRRKEVGGLINHNGMCVVPPRTTSRSLTPFFSICLGTITSLHFPSRSHLLTTSEDSTLSLFRTRDWTLLRSFKGHVGRVNSITVHPSGKLALTVGKDRVLRMWDLMKGKPGGGVKIGKEGESIRFSPSGDQFAILSTTTLDIYTKAMSLVQTVVNPKRFHDFEFVDVEGEGGKTRELMVAAVEEGYVRVFERFERATKAEKAKEAEEEEDTMEDEWKEIARLGGHSNRFVVFHPFPLFVSLGTE